MDLEGIRGVELDSNGLKLPETLYPSQWVYLSLYSGSSMTNYFLYTSNKSRKSHNSYK